MLLQVQSPVFAPTGRRMIVMLGVCSVWSWSASTHPIAQPGPQIGAQQGPTERFRFEVSDSENNRPLPNASVKIVFWRHEDGVRQKEELESRTDENGIVVFPKVQVEKLAVSVEAKGYRSDSRWINPRDLRHAIRIRLEKWRRAPK